MKKGKVNGMGMEIHIIIPEKKGTFGKLIYAGRGKNAYVYDKDKEKRTNILEARIYRLTSEVQGGQIEVHVPAEVDELDFNFMEEVEIINPVMTSRATSTKDSSFANLVWKCTVDTIKKKESGSMVKNTGMAKTPAEKVLNG